MNRIVIISCLFLSICSILQAQISPGELSRSHTQLEGVSNCSQCHEQGEEITGGKCLECHREIKEAIAAKHGYHFQNASSKCISCHKEHLGIDASITLFDKKTFDHNKTGFTLKGKHSSLQCESCHLLKNIKNLAVKQSLTQYSRQSFLGLSQQCNDCHTDRHSNSLGTACENCHGSSVWESKTLFQHGKTKFALSGKHNEVTCSKCHEFLRNREPSRPLLFTVKEFGDCKSCHASPHGQRFAKQLCRSCHQTSGWANVSGFNHSQTAFALIGKHSEAACSKCHVGLITQTERTKRDFTTKPFRDCSPCHTSPHAPSFAQKTCSSCHSPTQWSKIAEKTFDHSLTSFPLRGKHASLQCAQCHNAIGTQSFSLSFKLSKKACADCHEDRHRGQFKEKYTNDCSRCHTEQEYSPSTFSFEQHQNTRFVLAGAHAAVPCRDCHKKQADLVFRFAGITCSSCHTDRHNGQFNELMKERSCDVCHSTAIWKTLVFDHSRTRFPLIGQHAFVACARCHTTEADHTAPRYRGTSKECSDCHIDQHAGQFATAGITHCGECHSPIGRRALLFRHDLQSTFALSGAHANVDCSGCHKPDEQNGKRFIRYKPLSTKCESCHQGK